MSYYLVVRFKFNSRAVEAQPQNGLLRNNSNYNAHVKPAKSHFLFPFQILSKLDFQFL